MLVVTTRSIPSMRDERRQQHDAFRERDRGGDQRGGDDRGRLGGDQRRDPRARVDLARARRQHVHDEDRDARVQRELAHVEHELDRRQTPVEEQNQAAAEQAPEHERLGAAEDHAEHERDVAQRERVCPAAEVQMNHAALGDRERDRDRPPRQVRIGERRQAVHRPGVERHRGRDHRQVQPPDGMDLPRQPGVPAPGASGTWAAVRWRSRRVIRQSVDVDLGRRGLRTSIGASAEKLSVRVTRWGSIGTPSPMAAESSVGSIAGASQPLPETELSQRAMSFPFRAVCRQNDRARERVVRRPPVLSCMAQSSTPRGARQVALTGASQCHRRIVGN